MLKTIWGLNPSDPPLAPLTSQKCKNAPKMKKSPKLKKMAKYGPKMAKNEKLQKIQFIRGHPYDVQWPKNWWNPPKMKKKRPKNGPRHQKWPKNPKNGLIFQAFSKKFWFLDQIIYLYFCYMFWIIFPSCRNFGSKGVWGRCGLIWCSFSQILLDGMKISM